jgi:hypothetical protein
VKKLSNAEIGRQINQDGSNLTRLKVKNPDKYEILKLGTYIFMENIKEDELISWIEAYKKMKESLVI